MRQLSFSDDLAPRTAGARRAVGNRLARRIRARNLVLRLLRERARLLGASTFVLGLILAGGWWLLQPGNSAMIGDGANRTFVQATADLGLTVQNVYSLGHHEAKPEAILAALEISRGDPILTFVPDAARTRLLALDWVKSVTIERRLPDTIRVTIVERNPFALWQHDKRVQLVDHSGTIINAQDVPRFGHLPLIVGDGAPEKAPALFDMMRSEREIFHSLVSAVWVGARRWDLHLDNGLRVRFPETGTAAAWRRLVKLIGTYDMTQERIVSIDLRLPDRAVLGLRPDLTMDRNST